MQKFWNTSLAWQLVLIVCSSTAFFWLLSETASLYYLYKGHKHAILNNLIRLVEAQAYIENSRYLRIKQDAESLLKRWNQLQKLKLTPTHGQLPNMSLFLPFKNSQPNTQMVNKTLYTLGIFGMSNTNEYIDSFILLPNQGIVLLPPALPVSQHYLQARLSKLVKLQHAPIENGLRWGQAVYSPVHGWSMIVAAVQLSDNVMAGFSLSLNNLAPLSPHKTTMTTLLWQDPQGTLLPLLPSTPSPIIPSSRLLQQLPPCHTLTIRTIEDSVVICKPLANTPWKILLLYPSKKIRSEALALLSERLPFNVAALLFLIVTLYLILRNLLARPLSRFVEIIDNVSPSNLAHRLPENRKDELGRIAQAYNSLLTTIAAHYATLEHKVQERTQELDEAKHLAEQANQRKSDHITNISHEIRTPLNGIVGALSMLQQNPLSQDQQDLVHTALQSSGYLLSIVNNLLDFSRIEAGQMELCSEQTELLPLLDQAMLTINIKAKEKKLELYSIVMADVPQYMVLDELRVRQILVNLLGNAVKFTARGQIKLEATVRDKLLAITIEDTGEGIAADQQRQIFLPFSQVRQHENGSGLGLTIATRLANLMGGEIQLESRLNCGSRFTFLLPLNTSSYGPRPLLQGSVTAPKTLHPQLKIWGITALLGPNTALEPPELSYLPGKLWRKLHTLLGKTSANTDSHSLQLSPWSLKILVVDDVQTNRDILGKMLVQQGHQVIAAKGGLEALDLGKQQVFDLVLMDVRMPDLDGLEATRRWRDPEYGMLDAECAIIALTANAMPAERDRVCKAGMNDYLAKPVTLQQLAAAIEVAEKLQLERGVELMPNTRLQTPLLNLSEESIRQKLLSTLSQLHSTLQTAYHTHEREWLLETLHSLKGTAGQGGLDLVQQAAEQLEHTIIEGNWPSDRHIQHLATLIQQA